jgi:hypothetical protein
MEGNPMPGRIWYGIALALLVAAGVAATVLAFSRLNGLAKELPQVIVPGEADLTFHRPGTYTVFLERESVVNGQLFSTSDDIAELRVQLVSPNGAPITLSAPAMSSNYSFGGRSGLAVLACEITEPGKYHLAAGYPDGRQEPKGVLAIGLGVGGKILSTVLMTLGVAMTGFVVAVAIAAGTFWKRRKLASTLASAPPTSHT